MASVRKCLVVVALAISIAGCGPAAPAAVPGPTSPPSPTLPSPVAAATPGPTVATFAQATLVPATPIPTATATHVANAPNGKVVYERLNCAGCHGADAKSGPAKMVIPNADYLRITFTLKNGNSKMQPYVPSKMSEAEMLDVIAYLRTLK